MVKDSMVVLKGVQHNNLYYLKSNAITGQVMTFTNSDKGCTQLWHIRLGHTGKKSWQTLAKQDLLKGANTCKLEFCEHSIIEKKTKVRLGTATHCTEGILDYTHTDVWGPTKMASIRGNHYFVSFIHDSLGDVGDIL